MSTKNSKDIIGNRTSDLPARSALPQPTAPPLTPHIVQKLQFYGIPFRFISSLYNYYQPLDVLSVVSFAEIL
jgi:hypothetical protein